MSAATGAASEADGAVTEPTPKRRRTEPLVATIDYTRPRAGFERCGAVAGAPGFSLLQSTFKQQHGMVPCDFDPSLLGSEFVPVECEVGDARTIVPPPTISSHGYELATPELTPLTLEDANQPDSAPMQRHYREVEAAVAAACGASGVVAFCHVRRSPDPAVIKSSAGGLYAGYAHTDQAQGSWSSRLPAIVAAGEWERQGPPGVPPAFAERAARARRYAVVTAWRYLGPADACRASHLALLEPASLRADDFLLFDIAAFGAAGHNYRLRAPQDADAPEDASDAASAPAGTAADAGGTPPARAALRQPRHRWWHYPAMKPSRELLLLIAFDSAHPHAVPGGGSGPAEPFDGLPATAVFHSAFADPAPPPGEPERESLDTRVLCVWDD